MNGYGALRLYDVFIELSISGFIIAAGFFFLLVWSIFRIEGYRSIASVCGTTLLFALSSAFSKISTLLWNSVPLGFEFLRIRELVALFFLSLIPYFLASNMVFSPLAVRRFNRAYARFGIAAVLVFAVLAYARPQLFLFDPYITAVGFIDAKSGIAYFLSQALLMAALLYAMTLLSLDFLRWKSFKQAWSVQIGFFLCILFNLSAVSKSLFGFYFDPLVFFSFSRTAFGLFALMLFLVTGFFWLFLKQAFEVSQSRIAIETSHAEMHTMLYRDSLTGLPNRRCFSSDLSEVITHGRSAALILMDIDNFMEFNECFGDDSGDSVLKSASKTLSLLLPEGGGLYRMGGDEFSVLLRDCLDKRAAQSLAERINSVCGQGFEVGGKLYTFGMAMAVAGIPGDGESPEQVLSNAYSALHEAKVDNSVCLYTDSLKKDSLERIQTIQSLREDLRQGSFYMVYQPIHDRGGRVTAAEALLRWAKKDSLPVTGPDYFIPLLESSGLMPEMGELIIRLILKDIGRQMAENKQFPLISINLSPFQLKVKGLADCLRETFNAAGVPLSAVQFEVTESAFLEQSGSGVTNLTVLRAGGSLIAMDDFGTGYSNLAYLQKLPIDKIKIDQSFIRTVPGNPASEGLLTALTDIGRSFGMKLVAEGVETETQFNFLIKQGYDEYQGYLFSKPLLRADFLSYLNLADI